MDILNSGIPHLGVANVGTARKPLKMVTATVILQAWEDYLTKRRENGKEISDGTIKLNFGRYDEPGSRDHGPEINAYRHLLENQKAIRDSILAALSGELPRLKTAYYLEDADLPRETDEGYDLRRFIGPQNIDFSEESRDGLSYLEWHFNCAWDVEHGLAVLTHGERVLDIDRGDTDIWKIYADQGTLAEKREKFAREMQDFEFKDQKPWWKFR